MIKLHFPTSGSGLAMGLPIADAVAALEASAAELRIAAEKAPARSEGFGQRLAQAVKGKMRSRQPRFSAVTASAEPEESNFGEQIKKAVEQKSGKKQHEERVERERNRYRHQPRKRTKSE